jgi:hypothetical protein
MKAAFPPLKFLMSFKPGTWPFGRLPEVRQSFA